MLVISVAAGAAQSSDPLGERLLVAAVGPLVTVLVGGLVVWTVTSSVQRKREQADKEREQAREDALRHQEQQRAQEVRQQDADRADADELRELRARDDALRHELVTAMTEAAGSLYLTTQHYWRRRRAAGAGAPAEAVKALDDARATLDSEYLRSRRTGEVLESRLAAYFESTAPRDTWHRVMDLLTVRYFQLTGEDTDQLYAENEGDRHTGLSAADMRNPKRLLDAYRESLRAAVQCVFDSRLRDRS